MLYQKITYKYVRVVYLSTQWKFISKLKKINEST